MSAHAVVETERLVLRKFSTDDDAFVLELLNQPSFLRFIGDRGVRTLDDARAYIEQGPFKSYDELGFGLYVVTLKTHDTRIGMCGIVRKPWLDVPDIAYAFLPEFEGRGYATEAALAVLEYARKRLHLEHLVGVVTPDNTGSIGVLQKLGFVRASTVIDPRTNTELLLYVNR